MGNNSSISENVAGDGRDERELLGVVSALLKDDEALAEHCRELWAICGVDVVDFVPAEELQPVTQRLIDRMACRHPTTLERIGAVYTSFAGRQGLSLLEFQGYVACVLTQISRELEARVSGNLNSLDGRDDDEVSEQSSVCKTTPFAATFADSTKEAEVEKDEKAQKAPEAELSDIQKLTQELTSLNVSLSRHVESMEVSKVDAVENADIDITGRTGRTGTSRATDVESRQAKGEGALETNPTKEPEEASEMATLLTTLENLNRSLSQADQSQNHPSESSLASSQRVQSKASQLQVEESVQSSHAKHNAPFVVTPGPMHMPRQSQQSQQSHGYPGAQAAQMAARAQVSGPSGPWVHSTHSVEAIFPEPVQGGQGGQGGQGVQALPPEVSAIFDPGNTYARAVRGRNVPEPPGDIRAWTSMDVDVVHASQAETGGELRSDPAETLRPMANAFSSRLNGASKGIAHSWQAFADTMDSIFVPEARHDVDVEVAEPEVLTRPEVTEAPAPQYEDVPAIFRQPTVNEVQEVLEQEGLPAYVAIASAGTFCAKKLCLDSSSSPSLYVLEPDSSIPAVFFGMQGFCLDELRRIVLSEAPLDSTSKPLCLCQSRDFQVQSCCGTTCNATQLDAMQGPRG